MRNKGLTLLLFAAAVLSLVVPVSVLFMGDGDFSWHMTQPATYSMLVEIGILFLLLAVSCCFIRKSSIRLMAIAGIFLVFCWLHVVFLPMVISGLYMGYILMLGKLLRTRVLRVEVPYGIFVDFLLGAGGIITEFCLMSALGIGGIPTYRIVSLIQGIILLVFMIFSKKDTTEKLDGREKTDCFSGLGRTEWLMLSFVVLMLLIQIGKMNISLDFDTLWYGVRSEYILDWGYGIYENPGLVGMSYVYSKGLEVLLLPLSDLASHSYLLFFNIWMTIMGLMAVYRIARFYMERRFSILSVALLSAVPGVMNMSISAKTDIITWVLQLIMLVYLLCFVAQTKSRPVRYLILAAGAYLLSLTMKPTSLVFSTALFGMAGLYLIATKTVAFKAPVRHWLLLLPSTTALIGIWARTMLITGMPVTSVFTSIFAKLGFQMKYPFATGSLPQNYKEESSLQVLLRRLYQMLLAPEGKDMGHVVIAWGTSLLFFLIICIFVYFLVGKREERGSGGGPVVFAHVLFWPFFAVNLVSLVMLYQVDGNYFILLYTAVILFSCRALSCFLEGGLRSAALWLLIPILIFNVLVSAVSNWAWSLGFSEIKLLNKGRVNHEKMQYHDMITRGNEGIWNILAADSSTRVIAFGDHPYCLEFPCNVQSYKDITAPWGNVEIVNSPEAFEEYMSYAKTDYIYVEAGYIGENSWSWSYGLLQELISRGLVGELVFENGNVLARVNVDNGNGNDFNNRSQTAQENLKLFMEQYITAQ